MNVPIGNIVGIHTNLRPSLLPGGYTAELLYAFPNAQLSCAHITAPGHKRARKASPRCSSTSR
jgi:hypothetical protein